MEDYTRILLHEVNTTPGESTRRNAPISNDTLVQLTKKKLEGFIIPSSRSEDKIEKVVRVLILAKNFIGCTLQSEPHAAIAWAGVSMFLPVSEYIHLYVPENVSLCLGKTFLGPVTCCFLHLIVFHCSSILACYIIWYRKSVFCAQCKIIHWQRPT